MRSDVHNLPELFLKRLKQLVPSQKFDAVANSFTEVKPTSFRVNTLKVKSNEIKERLSSLGFQLKNVSWCNDAFILQKGKLRDLEKTEIYQEGEIYVQNLSTLIPALAMEPKEGETILDLTAAPGGKTSHIACLMNGEGRIVANESNQIRFERLKANLKIQGIDIAEAVMSYGESFGNKYPEIFDRVLVDAPCTAEGRFLTSEPASYRYWNLSKISEASKLQKKLIISGLKALKPGGVLVYSTCTLAPEENEEVIEHALNEFKQKVEIEPVKFSLPNQMIGLLRWEKKEFHPSIKRTIRILPTNEMEGFFLARIKKTGSFN